MNVDNSFGSFFVVPKILYRNLTFINFFVFWGHCGEAAQDSRSQHVQSMQHALTHDERIHL